MAQGVFTTKKEITSLTTENNGRGDWRKFKSKQLEGKKSGEVRDERTYDEGMVAIIDKDGVYEMTYTKGEKYWDLTAAKYLGPVGSADGNAGSNSGGSGGSSGGGNSPRVLDSNVLLQNRCITAQVCVKGAAEVVSAGVAAGTIQVSDGQDQKDAIVELFDTILFNAMERCQRFIANKPSEAGEEKKGGQEAPSGS